MAQDAKDGQKSEVDIMTYYRWEFYFIFVLFLYFFIF